jgi:circadian clock protein KaiC
MPERDLVKTGIKGLDDLLAGGFPRGNLIVVTGAAGSGKTTMGVEFIYRGAREFDEPGMIVLFEVAPDKLARDAAQFGWDLADLERAGKLRIIFTTRQVFQQEMQQADSLLLSEAAHIRARRIFVDSFGPIVPENNGNGQGAPRDAFHMLIEGLHRENLTAMLTLEYNPRDTRGSTGAEEFLADSIVRLTVEPNQRAVSREIEIVKSRGHEFQMGRHSFRIADGRGVECYRRVQAPRSQSRDHAGATDPTRRITSGVPGLDDLTNGGYLLGSTTLVVGLTGTGKSIMGIHYIAEGVSRGERGLMLSLDEPVGQILRNCRTIGHDLEPAIDQRLARIVYDAPQEIEIDRHFHQIEELVREFQPQRMVLDSLSTYGSTLGPSGRVFRDFFHAIVALMKEHQVTAVYNHENPELLGMGSVMGDFSVSSLVDNIVLMNFVELGDTFRHALTVTKTRGNPVRRTTHEVEIENGVGMRVLPRAIQSALPSAPFASYRGLIARSPERRSTAIDPTERRPD